MATKKPIKPQWAGIGYGRKKRAHIWSDLNIYFVRSNCGIELLAEHLKSATGLERCKTCEKAGGHHG
jgi:hypothetical protein